jgi:PAS domain S-box-containing protein
MPGVRRDEGAMRTTPVFLDHRGEMAARLREFDWSTHPLGDPAEWPTALRLALDLCLGSQFPTAIYWGKELHLLYNDAWAPIPAERHPRILGLPAREAWPDIWEVIGPQLTRVLGGEGFAAYEQMLPMVRAGHPAQTWWNYSFSAIRDDAGAVGGVFNQGHEVTQGVLAERRLVQEIERTRESETRLQLALDSSMGIGTWEWDIANDIVRADARFARLYGVDPIRAAEGGPIEEFFASIHPQDLVATRLAIEHSLATGEPYESEYRLTTLDGRMIWVTAQGRPTYAEDGSLARFPGVSFDITERRAAEEAARAAVEELRVAMEAQAFIYDLASQLRALDDAPSIMGLVSMEVAGRLGVDRAGFFRVDPDEAMTFETGWSNGRLPLLTGTMPTGTLGDGLRAAYRRGETIVIRDSTREDGFIGAAARALSASGLGIPLLRGGGLVAGLHVGHAEPRDWTVDEIALCETIGQLAWDAVQRVDTLAALRESEGKFRAIANSIDQMVWSALPDGSHDYFNERWYEYTGVPHGSTDGEAWNGMFHPEDQDRALEAWRHCLTTGDPYRIEYRLRHHSGEYRWVLGSAQPVRDDRGAITRWFGSCTDIEEIVAAREVLARSRLELEQAVAERTSQLMVVEERLRQAQKMEAVGQLTGGIAHDFNNMLAVVIGALDLLERRIARGRTDVERYVDAARDGATRAAALTQRLLSFSRQAPIAPVPVDCNALIAGMTELLGRSLGETVRIDTQLTEGVWHAIADPSQLENAVLNLSVNARDAMPGGGTLTLHTGNTTLDLEEATRMGVAPGDFVCIAVTDTGSGMPPEVAARAFDPFFTTKSVGKGTGLGLSQVFGFVGQLGGHAALETRLGEGTTVRLLLPRSSEAPAPAAERRLPDVEARGEHHETVMVVEDEDRVRNFSVEALRELGYSVVHAASGREALAILDAGRRADLLFTDVVMPEMNGPELAREASARLPGLRVLYTSGYTRDALPEGSMLGGGVVAKPFDIATLAARVRAALDGTAESR